MTKTLQKEIQRIIDELKLNCTIKEFKNEVDWVYISCSQNLSEEFIREFQDEIGWNNISYSQNLSESFIREFKDKVDWTIISFYQTLSESFIREFKDKVNWDNISYYQTLSEDFIREFKNEVEWVCISSYQTLSESFIREFKNKVCWTYIAYCQTLSKEFIEEFKDKIDIEFYNEFHQTKTIEEKIKEIKDYATLYNLEFDGKYLYAFRNHDKNGCGAYNKTIRYEKGKYYRDWHCDMRKYVENSFGLGIWPKGNTKVKVKVEDWGVCVNRVDGKCRVWGFEIA